MKPEEILDEFINDLTVEVDVGIYCTRSPSDNDLLKLIIQAQAAEREKILKAIGNLIEENPQQKYDRIWNEALEEVIKAIRNQEGEG